MSLDPAALARAASAVKPLQVAPEVWSGIRPMQFRDARRVAELHAAAMGTSLWGRLGPGFLQRLYEVLVNDPRFLAFVYEERPAEDEPRRIRGFIAGSTDTRAMFETVFRKDAFILGPAALLGLLRHPRALRPLLETARYFDQSAPEGELAIPGESLFCSFEPDLRGQRVSGAINKVLFDELRSRGHRHVKITTEVDNAGANRQLTSWGFVDAGRFRFYGKEMVAYVLDLEASPRVAPVGRHPSV